jgi:hypothetical protein
MSLDYHYVRSSQMLHYCVHSYRSATLRTAVALAMALSCIPYATGQSCPATSTRSVTGMDCQTSGTCTAGIEYENDNTCFDVAYLYCTGSCTRCTGAGTGGLNFCVVGEGTCGQYSTPTCPVPCGLKVTYACAGGTCDCPTTGGTPTTTPCTADECLPGAG